MPESVEVELGRRTLKVPVRESVEQTLAAVRLVNERLAVAEERVPVVDDLLYALAAALDIAEDYQVERVARTEEREAFEKEREQDTKEFLVALDELSGQVNDILTGLNQPNESA